MAGNLWRAATRHFVGLEAGSLGLFALLSLGQVLSPGWTAANALWLSFAGLGVISLLSLLFGRPWTSDYARMEYPGNAGTPQFRIINAAISGLWGGLFLAIGLCRWLGVSDLITAAIVTVGALISIFGPKGAIDFSLRRLRDAQEDFGRYPELRADGNLALALVTGGALLGGVMFGRVGRLGFWYWRAASSEA